MKCTYRVTPKLYEKSYNEELITNNEPFYLFGNKHKQYFKKRAQETPTSFNATGSITTKRKHIN